MNDNAISKTIIFSILLVAISCSSIKSIFREEALNRFDAFHLKQAIDFERSAHAIDATPAYLITIGESIYPNNKKFVLATPQTFRRKENGFEIETEYFYTKPDSLVRVVLYEWNEPVNRRGKGLSNSIPNSNLSELAKFDRFQNKFNEIKNELTKRMGAPYESEMGHFKNENSFRDGLKWKANNGLNAYLFMFGNNSNSYRQIRLAVYDK